LQERRFRRVGGTQELEADVRFIAATNRHLEEMVKTGAFREDFFFRINVISVRLPALRERVEDVPILAEQFVRRFAERMGRPVRGIAMDAMRLLIAYRWPGNVRELENVMERGVALEQSAELTVESLPPHLSESSSGSPSAVEVLPAAGFNLETHLQQIAETGRRGASEGRGPARHHLPAVPLPGQEVPAEVVPKPVSYRRASDIGRHYKLHSGPPYEV
jgi:transcriptional regulator with PAS, ATPase and Fis domain